MDANAVADQDRIDGLQSKLGPLKRRLATEIRLLRLRGPAK